MRFLNLTTLASTALICTAPGALALQSLHCSETPLAPAAGQGSAVFGSTLALDGRQAAIARFLDGAGPGQVHLYEMVPPNSLWVEAQLVEDPEPDLVSYGETLALNGKHLLISDPDFVNGGGIRRGRVHAFFRNNPKEDFVLLQRFFAPAGGALGIGQDLALRGDDAVVSAPGITLANPQPRLFTYSFDSSLGEWVPGQALQAPVSTVPTQYGSGGMDMVGDLLAVGDPVSPILPTFGAPESGTCHLYRQDPVTKTWAFEATLLPPNPQDGARFGRPAVISDTQVAVLAEAESDMPGGPVGGRVHIFERDGAGAWGVIQTLRSDDVLPVGAAMEFGSLAVDGDLLVAGQPDYDLPAGAGQGRVLVYRRDLSGQWIPESPLERGPAGGASHRLGATVDVVENRVLVASPGEMGLGGSLGAVAAVDLTIGDCNSNQVQDSCDVITGIGLDRNADQVLDACQNVGTTYCAPGVPNSTGQVAGLAGLVSAEIGSGMLLACAEGLPLQQFGYLLGSSGQDVTSMPGTSVGDLCLTLGNDFGRFSTQIVNSDQAGVSCTVVDFSAVPTGVGAVVLTQGDVWNFQFWYRDGAGVSNFTTAMEVTIP